ncbi:MAG: ATP-binding protein, partial [Candidatus Aenigmarchaeota archaeon]|nr:ATP-binding protein [Candidatus Aenigmarchaeota archaeon]MDW8149665.1 ATP-binding protein [Candidatus Aenigmarchaeota archaeon]
MFKRELVENFFEKEVKFLGIEREIKIDESINKIISIIGPRRSGKTFYFFYLFEKLKNPLYIDFENIAFRNLTIEEFFEIIKIFTELKYKPITLLLDEIQCLKEWQVLVRSLHDLNYKVFITGSSSKLLSKEIATQLRGRVFSYLLLPFSFREFLKVKNVEINIKTFEGRGEIIKFLKEYLTFGGYPEVVISYSNKEKILKEYFDEIFLKDFVERHRIKNMEFGRFLFEFCFQNFSSLLSIKKIKNYFGKNISEKTLYDYVNKLQDTLAVFFLEKYGKTIYLRKSWPRKVYVADIGISNILLFSEDWGRRMENTVFLELLRRTNENPLLQIYFFKTNSDEVDFVIKEGLKIKQLIQVTYSSGKDEIERREIKA